MSTAQPALETTENRSLAWKGGTGTAIHVIWQNLDGGFATPSFKLNVTAVQNLKSGQKLTMSLVDGSDPARPQLLDTFRVTLARLGELWSFRGLEDPRPPTHPVKAGKHGFTDHINIVLPGINDAFVSILKPTPTLEPGLLCLKVSADDSPVHVQGIPPRVARRYEYETLSKFLHTGDELAHTTSALIPRAPESDDIPNLAERDRVKFEDHTRAMKELSDQMDKMLENPNTTLLVHLSQVRQYRRNLRELLDLNEKIKELESSVGHAIFAPYYLGLWTKRKFLVQETEQFKEQARQFLDIDEGIPEEYRKLAQRGTARRREIEQIQTILDNPVVKLVCCLPMGGVVEGALLIMQGKYAEGLFAAGMDVLTYGGLGRIANLPGLYHGISQLDRVAIESIFQWRYFKVLWSREEGILDGIKMGSRLTEGNLAAWVSPVFGMSANTLQLLLQARDVYRLYLNRKEIRAMLANTAGMGADQVKFYNNLGRLNNAFMVFGGIRAVAIAAQGGVSGMKLYNAISTKTKEEKAKEMQERTLAALREIKSLVPASECVVWDSEMIESIKSADSKWFVPGRGLFENWESAHAAWIQEIERIWKEEKKKTFKPMEFNSEEQMKADLAKILERWHALEKLLLQWVEKHKLEANEASYKQAYGDLPLGRFASPLDRSMESFREQVSGALALMGDGLADTETDIESLVYVINANVKPPRVYYVSKKFEEKATKAIEAIHAK